MKPPVSLPRPMQKNWPPTSPWKRMIFFAMSGAVSVVAEAIPPTAYRRLSCGAVHSPPVPVWLDTSG